MNAPGRGCVPVVAATGGLPEVVRDGQDGLLHEPGSAESLADRVLVLVNDRALLRRLSEGARRRAADFAPEAYRRRIAALYDEI